MGTIRPSFDEIVTRIDKDAQARCDNETLRRSDFKVLLRVLAGASHQIYSAIDYAQKQLFLDTCDTEYLDRQSSIYGITRKKATKATGNVKFNWIKSIEIPLGTVIQNSVGLQYETISAVDSNGECTIRALVAGTDSNLKEGEELNLISAIMGVNNVVAITDITGGIDAEEDNTLRERSLFRTRNPPRAGTKEDYEAWAKEYPGVTRAWCYPKEQGDGTVVVRIMADDTEDRFPSSELLEEVQDYIKKKSSVLGEVYVISPIKQVANLTLKITPDNLSIREKAKERLKELFEKEAKPGELIYLSHINAALSEVEGEIDHVVIAPSENIQPENQGSLIELGDITWQES